MHLGGDHGEHTPNDQPSRKKPRSVCLVGQKPYRHQCQSIEHLHRSTRASAGRWLMYSFHFLYQNDSSIDTASSDSRCLWWCAWLGSDQDPVMKSRSSLCIQTSAWSPACRSAAGLVWWGAAAQAEQTCRGMPCAHQGQGSQTQTLSELWIILATLAALYRSDTLLSGVASSVFPGDCR